MRSRPWRSLIPGNAFKQGPQTAAPVSIQHGGVINASLQMSLEIRMVGAILGMRAMLAAIMYDRL